MNLTVARTLAVTFAIVAVAGGGTVSGVQAQSNASPASAPPQSSADRLAAILKPTADFTKAEPYEVNSAGAATSREPINISAFSHFSANMDFERQLQFKVGDGIFRKLWVSAPSSTQSSDGLGPLFNSRSCQGCHLKDGRGSPPAPGEVAVSMFLRLSIPPQNDEQRRALAAHSLNVIPEPTYGGQLQNFAIQGHDPEGQMTITYEDVPVKLADGELVKLRKPTYGVKDLGYGPMQKDVLLSPRVAQPMIGLGFLELIDEADILANADPDDKNGDGISGRPNMVWDFIANKPALGRFGWKAGEPTVRQQSAHAAGGDIGISSALAPNASGDCTDRQKTCIGAPNGNDREEGVEMTAQMLDLVELYARNLAVPARRKVGDKTVLAGKKLFYDSGCSACHRPKYVTPKSEEMPEQSGQLIWPYTDLLLHDMGEGLADNRPEGVASGREWRTAPLWGIGLTETVSGHTYLLHDGRARNLLEAILWHGGEAEAAKDRVAAMTRQQRAALIAFLNSL